MDIGHGHWLYKYLGKPSGGSGGGGSEPLIVRFDHNDGDYEYYDKTWQEIHDAMLTSSVVLVHRLGEIIANIRYISGNSEIDEYYVQFSLDGNYKLYADSANGYVYEIGGTD